MSGPTPELADIFRQHGPAYRRAHPLPLYQHRLMQATETCRTAVSGGSVEWCDRCQYSHIRYRCYENLPAVRACSVNKLVKMGLSSFQGYWIPSEGRLDNEY
jgi:hypothetical protein